MGDMQTSHVADLTNPEINSLRKFYFKPSKFHIFYSIMQHDYLKKCHPW